MSAKREDIFTAASHGNIDLVRRFLHEGADINAIESVMGEACGNGHLSCVRILRKKNMKLNEKNSVKETPLHLACFSGNFEVVEYLLNHLVKINQKSIVGYTPLHCAVLRKHFKIVQLLICAKCSVNVRDKWQNTPLHLACSNNDKKMVKYLLWKNADTHIRNNQNKTPRGQSSNKEVKAMIREYEANKDVFRVNAEDEFADDEIDLQKVLKKRLREDPIDDPDDDDENGGVENGQDLDLMVMNSLQEQPEKKMGIGGRCQCVFWTLLCFIIIIAMVVSIVLLAVYFESK